MDVRNSNEYAHLHLRPQRPPRRPHHLHGQPLQRPAHPQVPLPHLPKGQLLPNRPLRLTRRWHIQHQRRELEVPETGRQPRVQRQVAAQVHGTRRGRRAQRPADTDTLGRRG